MVSAPYTIRKARRDDLARLQTVEREAAKLFADVGLGGITDDDATSLADFMECLEAGMLWVAAAGDDTPVGFAYVEIVGGLAHLDELDVHPDHGRRGLGAALVQTVLAWARAQEIGAVTLTTFREVPWNMPFYERLGFRALDPAELSPELRAVVEAETRRGLPPEQRVVMRHDLS